MIAKIIFILTLTYIFSIYTTQTLSSLPSETLLHSRVRKSEKQIAKDKSKPKHHLSILIPFREKESDKNSQGWGREKNLREWKKYMCHFLPKVGRDDVTVHIIEQTQDGLFNKGALFNVGYYLSKSTSDYMVLHDVDHVPESFKNTYGFQKDPLHMCVRTSQFNYRNVHQGSLGGALMISMNEYERINGYSNLFLGWGGEDDNLGLRIGKRINKLPPEIGRYKALDHKRIMGLDITDSYKNHPDNDLVSGISSIKWKVLLTKIDFCDKIKFVRSLVKILI